MKKGWLLFLAAVLFLYLRSHFAAEPIRTVILEDKLHEEVMSTEAVVVRDEVVFRSGIGGAFERVAAEGERVRAGTSVAVVSRDSHLEVLESPGPGVVSYFLDGLEERLNANTLSTLAASEVEEVSQGNVAPRQTGGNVRKGQPVYRLVNDRVLYLLTPGSRLFPGKVALRLGTRVLEGKVKYWPGEGDGPAVIELDRLPYEALAARKLEIQVILRKKRGISVPEGAIVEGPSGPGVYTIKKRKAHYLPVTVVDTFGYEVLIEGVNAGTEVIVNPQGLKEGDEV